MKTIIKSFVFLIFFPVVAFASSDWNSMVWDSGDVWYIAGEETGSVKGTILASFLNYDDLKVSNATVTINGTDFTATTDENGYFTISGIAPGDYAITVTADNLSQVSGEIVVSSGGSHIVDLPLMTLSCPTEGSYTAEQLEQAVLDERLKWDANEDGEIGLSEAIHALQVVSGVNNHP